LCEYRLHRRLPWRESEWSFFARSPC
jgi:hypothetical protein